MSGEERTPWWRDRAFWAGFSSIWDLSGQRGVREIEAAAEKRRRRETGEREQLLRRSDWPI